MALTPPVTARFSLIDDQGQSATPVRFRGRWMLVYFGFTHCKVVCPRSLAKLSAVLERVDPEAKAIVALYVTVDPERDTPDVMRNYLAEHHPRFTGLTGTREQIDEAKRSFRVFATPRAGESVAEYDVPHTAIAYLIDPAGDYRAHFAEHVDADKIVARLTTIIGEEQRACA